MEEKILNLLKAINIYTERSKENYAEFKYESENKIVEICIRDKKTYDYKQCFEFYLDKNGLLKIEDIIEKLKEED